jgi:GNAT superfamily N-acetyltransferase
MMVSVDVPEIRRARADEAEAVTGIVMAAYEPYIAIIGAKPGPMLDDYAARIAADQVWVLTEYDALLGVLVLENSEHSFLLDNIAIGPGQQGGGHGRRLLDFAEAQAKEAGWDRITLYTNARMTDNIAIYEKRGYVVTDRRRESGFDRVYMDKRLVT